MMKPFVILSVFVLLVGCESKQEEFQEVLSAQDDYLSVHFEPKTTASPGRLTAENISPTAELSVSCLSSYEYKCIGVSLARRHGDDYESMEYDYFLGSWEPHQPSPFGDPFGSWDSLDLSPGDSAVIHFAGHLPRGDYRMDVWYRIRPGHESNKIELYFSMKRPG